MNKTTTGSNRSNRDASDDHAFDRDIAKSLAISVAAAFVMAALAFGVPAQAATKAAAAAPPAAPVAAEPQAQAQSPAPASAVDRIRAAGRIVLGYRADAAPFSYRDASGRPAGYSVAVCTKVADALKIEFGQPSLGVEWVAVGRGYDELRQGSVDLICAADEVTQAHRALASFSIPVFPGGVSALLRANAADALQRALDERPAPYQPLWRGTPPPTLEHRTYAALGGSMTLEALQDRVEQMRLKSSVEPVTSYEAGVAKVLDGTIDVLFGERGALLEGALRSADPKALRVLPRRYTFAAVALALPRNDDDFRLAVDRALSAVYADPAFANLYSGAFGAPDSETVAYFRAVVVPR